MMLIVRERPIRVFQVVNKGENFQFSPVLSFVFFSDEVKYYLEFSCKLLSL